MNEFQRLEARVNPLLQSALLAAVPLWVWEMMEWPEEQVRRTALNSMNMIAEHGDALICREKGRSAEAFNALAKGIASLSFCPGGVTTFGMHFDFSGQRELAMRLEVKRMGKWWITGGDSLVGPYDTRGEAEEDRRGLVRFNKHKDEPGFVTGIKKEAGGDSLPLPD